jgi:hypothetical protein
MDDGKLLVASSAREDSQLSTSHRTHPCPAVTRKRCVYFFFLRLLSFLINLPAIAAGVFQYNVNIYQHQVTDGESFAQSLNNDRRRRDGAVSAIITDATAT